MSYRRKLNNTKATHNIPLCLFTSGPTVQFHGAIFALAIELRKMKDVLLRETQSVRQHDILPITNLGEYNYQRGRSLKLINITSKSVTFLLISRRNLRQNRRPMRPTANALRVNESTSFTNHNDVNNHKTKQKQKNKTHTHTHTHRQTDLSDRKIRIDADEIEQLSAPRRDHRRIVAVIRYQRNWCFDLI
jgi:hypothetical protein